MAVSAFVLVCLFDFLEHFVRFISILAEKGTKCVFDKVGRDTH